MTKRYVTISFIVDGPAIPTKPPSLEALVYQGLFSIDAGATASDVSLSWESETKHEHFDTHQKKVDEYGKRK